MRAPIPIRPKGLYRLRSVSGLALTILSLRLAGVSQPFGSPGPPNSLMRTRRLESG